MGEGWAKDLKRSSSQYSVNKTRSTPAAGEVGGAPRGLWANRKPGKGGLSSGKGFPEQTARKKPVQVHSKNYLAAHKETQHPINLRDDVNANTEMLFSHTELVKIKMFSGASRRGQRIRGEGSQAGGGGVQTDATSLENGLEAPTL